MSRRSPRSVLLGRLGPKAGRLLTLFRRKDGRRIQRVVAWFHFRFRVDTRVVTVFAIFRARCTTRYLLLGT